MGKVHKSLLDAFSALHPKGSKKADITKAKMILKKHVSPQGELQKIREEFEKLTRKLNACEYAVHGAIEKLDSKDTMGAKTKIHDAIHELRQINLCMYSLVKDETALLHLMSGDVKKRK
jgi:hypothetical protein